MSLRTRISLLVTVLTLLVAAGFGVLTYRNYLGQQDAQLRSLLQSDLERTAAVISQPALGDSLAGSEADSYVLQFLDPAGRVVIAWGDRDPLPAAPQPRVVSLGGRRHLLGETEWQSTGGSIRLAHDVEAQYQARAGLARNLFMSGLLVTLLAGLAGLVATRRMLRPLQLASAQVRTMDAEASDEIRYQGPPDEISNLTDALNSALATIRSRRDDERAFLLEIAHELAAPLTLVRYHLSESWRSHPEDRRLAAAASAAGELLHTSQDLLALARGELDRPLDQRVFSLRELLDKLEAEYPGLHVDATEAGEIVGDRQRLMQVARNLVRNGIQAAGSVEKVWVSVALDDEHYCLEVRDEGPGIGEEELPRLFERGFSGHRGLGVGLNVANTLVEKHGGALEVHSAPGEGSRFVVRLPSFESRLAPEAPAADVTA